MANIDVKTCEAFARLRGNPDFATVLSWITQRREACKEMLICRPVSDIQLIQGEARAFGSILEANETALDVLRRAQQ